ncbi:hydrogenase nickel incorporation protein HypA (plasmid) [Pandoraea faecigallinarum]|uniref:Hydrogenase nickel incorporation protein HypA n=1 Tax=Pandoraea faecigallinarum TaxID=656179 RepID=A0A0H3X081_9BURK|nr:hydrogenase/urease maturation nickel metallochaperone HypA [Pandoraea faecigallinarum]AKM33295.1 hydrogenase nickel incorporation protein HypA [Pandoraea faecigallinarum]
MHETGIVRDLVRKVESAAAQAGAGSVREVQVWLGALSGFSPAHFREHFDEEVRGTSAEHAMLRIVASYDVHDAHAQHVMLQSLELEVPDGGGESK